MSNAPSGVASSRSNTGAPSHPAVAAPSPSIEQKPMADPNARRAVSMSRRPTAWPMTTVDAMPNPNTTEYMRNMMRLALAVAASACAPRKRPTQIALIDPLSDWRILDTRVGMAKSSSADAIGACVRSLAPCPGPLIPALHDGLPLSQQPVDPSPTTPTAPAQPSTARPPHSFPHGPRAPWRRLRAWPFR